jgi:hypothetical protein
MRCLLTYFQRQSTVWESKPAYFFLHFMPVPNNGFINKPKLVAWFGKYNILSENTVVTGGPFVPLSIHASQRDTSPESYFLWSLFIQSFIASLAAP